jgi:hypothetical protein
MVFMVSLRKILSGRWFRESMECESSNSQFETGKEEKTPTKLIEGPGGW